jgi:uncharacterized repeat protein (TIGR01451 family)
MVSVCVAAQQVQYRSQFRNGEIPLAQELSGPAALRTRLEADRSSISVALGDFDGDGVQDLVTGYASGATGAVTLQRGFAGAIAPGPAESAAIQRGEVVAPFAIQAAATEVPVRPDFLKAIDLNGDGALDIVVAERGGNAIYVLNGDGAGRFSKPVAVGVSGTISALTTWRGKDGLAVLLAGVCDAPGTCALQVVGADGGVRASVALPAAASALETGALNGGASQDVVVVSGGKALLIDGDSLLNGAARVETLPVSGVANVVAGSFVYDKRGLLQLAVLGADASLHVLARARVDDSQLTAAEVRANRARRPGIPQALVRQAGMGWVEAETLTGIGPAATGGDTPVLLRGRMTGNSGDDLVVMFGGRYMQIAHPAAVNGATLQTTPVVTAGSTIGTVAAAVTARVTPDARQSVVTTARAFQANVTLPPTNRTMHVNTTADGAVTSASKLLCTNNSAGCTLRSAIAVANTDAAVNGVTKVDTINVDAGTYKFTTAYNPGVDSQNNIGYHYDLDASMNIIGAGTGSTIIDGNLLDKVFSVDSGIVNAYAPFDVFLSGMTLQNGKNLNNPNVSPFPFNNFGGLIDWEADGTGYLTLNNVILTNGTAMWGPGGAIGASNTIGGIGTLEIDNSTISNNNTPEVGGGVYVGLKTPLILSSTTFSANNAKASVNAADAAALGQGGGLFADGNPANTVQSTIVNSPFASNGASDAGGGIYSLTGFAISGSQITNNTAGTYGGGLFFNTASETGTVTSTTVTGNAAATDGGGIFVGSSNIANVLNIHYSRIKGNTSTSGSSGIGVGASGADGGTVNATQNWWGCNGPATGTNCDTGALNSTLSGSLTLTPYTRLTMTLSATTIPLGQPLTATGDLAHDSTGAALGAANLGAYVGLPANVTIVLANNATNSVSGGLAANTADLSATDNPVTYPGVGSASITVDGFTSTASFTVTAPDMTVTSSHTGNFHSGDTGDTFTLIATNSGNAPTTANVTVADTLPAGFTATGMSGTGWTCTLATASCTRTNSSDVFAAGVALPTITLTVNVGSGVIGSLSNTVVVSGGGEFNTANDSYSDVTIVIGQPTAALSFVPTTVAINANSALTFAITNPAANAVSLTGIGFSDALPANLVVATPNGLTGSCGGGTITATAGSGTVSLSGASLAAGVTCTFSVNVKSATAGSYPDSFTASSANGGSSATASATLIVAAPPSITGSFGAANIQLNASTSLTFSISNPNSTTGLTGVGFSDSLPAGLVVSTPNTSSNSCGGTLTQVAGSSSITLSGGSIPASGSCAIVVSVTGTTSGLKSNNETVTSTEGGTGNNSVQSVTVALAASKLIYNTAPATPIAAGGNAGTVVVYEEDSANNLTTGAHDLITLTVTGPNSYSQLYSVTAVGGVASFNLSSVALNTAGTYTYSATVTGLTAATATEIVNPGAAVTFAVSGFVNPAQTGVAGTVTVTAKDSFGNTATGFTGAVAITSSDSLAVLPAPYAYVAGDNGVHNFSVTLNTAVTQSITATSNAITGSQTGIAVLDSVWVLNSVGTLARLTDAGVLTGVGGVTGGPSTLGAVVVDYNGNVWSVGNGSSVLVETSFTGAPLSGSGFTGGGINAPSSVAVDGYGQVWVANGNNSVSVFSPSGANVTPGAGYQGGNMNTPSGIIVDSSGSVWISNSGNSSVTKIIGAAGPVVAPTVTGTSNATLGVRP